jgi:hypothetical protein
MRQNTIRFLEYRGFRLDQVDEGFEIRIGRRSLPGGLEEIFVATDELEGLGDLGRRVVKYNLELEFHLLV